MIRTYLHSATIILGVLLFTGLAQGQDSLQALYKTAKAEGQVILWSPADSKGIRMLMEAFNKKFPGIKVTHFEIRPDDYVSRAIAEARQDRISFDVGTGRLVGIAPLLERVLVQAYDDWREIFKDLNPPSLSNDGRLLTIYSLFYPIAYNTNLTKPEDVPASWNDLLVPNWKGKIIIEPRANAFGYLGLKWGEEKMVSYLNQLRAQKPIFVKGGTAVAQQLVAGAAPLAVGTYRYKIRVMKVSKAPIDWARNVSPIGATENVAFVMKGAKHPNAAKLLAGWLATEEAQNLIDQMPLKGVTPPGSSSSAAEDLRRSGIEVAKETLENYKRAVALNRAAVKALGVLK